MMSLSDWCGSQQLFSSKNIQTFFFFFWYHKNFYRNWSAWSTTLALLLEIEVLLFPLKK